MIAYFITQLFVSEQNKIAIDGRRKISCANFTYCTLACYDNYTDVRLLLLYKVAVFRQCGFYIIKNLFRISDYGMVVDTRGYPA